MCFVNILKVVEQNQSVDPPFCWGEGLNLQPRFQKGGLTGSHFLGEDCWEKGKDLFQEGGCSFYIKSKLKSEIFHDKKSLKTKLFFSVITKNLNWEILTKNLVTF